MAVKTRDILVIGGIAVAGGLAYWWWTTRPPEEEFYECPYCGAIFSSQSTLDIHIASAHGPGPPPDITSYVETAIQSAAQAEAAADAALLAETEAEVGYYASVAVEASDTAADAAAQAILLAGTVEAAEAIDAANRAEAAAREAMAELEGRWRQALEIAEAEMNTAVRAADIAYGAYEDIKELYDGYMAQKAAYCSQLKTLWQYSGHSVMHMVINLACPDMAQVLYFEHDTVVRARELAAAAYQALLYALELTDGMERARIEARFAAFAARDATERALTIAADVRLLGILTALTYRIDSIARATRDTLNRMLEELAE